MDLWWILYSPAFWTTAGVAVAFLLYRKATANFDVFSKKGIRGPKPLPVVGNLWGIWRENIPEYDTKLVQQYGKTFGYFDGTTANLFTVDEQLLKNVLVKDFDHFVNRRDFKVTSYVFRMFLTMLQDQKWKDVRSSITPTFTSGKIKRMSALIKECSDRLADKLEKSVKDNDGKFEAKKAFSSFTMDVIARCAFGMKIQNLGEKDDPFIKNAAFVFDPPSNHKPTIILPFIFRSLNIIIAQFIFITKQFQFFVGVLENLVKSRENTTEKYHDFVEIASEALAESVKQDPSTGKTVPMWTKEEAKEIVISQSVLFLLAGFDTTGTTLSNVFFMLAKYPDIQQRLYTEICEKMEQTGNEDLNHDLVNSIPYVEQIINETLRLFPPGLRLERECSKDITYGNCTIKKGMVVSVPVYVLHRMEEYYPEPEKFDPDRWSPENRNKISPYVFLPFGSGPRNCVGMRFAMEEMKFAICKLVMKYRFFPIAETPDNIEFIDGFVLVMQAKKFNLGIELRQ